MSSVANLNREELLKRAKELEDLLDASKPKPSGKATPLHSSASVKRSATFPRSQFVLSRTEQPLYTGANGKQKLATTCRGASRAPLSHNRVFVRNTNREKQTRIGVRNNAKASESNRVTRTEPVALPASLASSSKSAESSVLLANHADDSSASGKPTSSGRDSQNEARDNWLRKQETLVLTIGGDESSEDDELIRDHHTALRNILHPVKPLISRGHQRKSVVYQSATKLVKINSPFLPETLGRQKLESQKHSSLSNFTPGNRKVSNKHSSSATATSSIEAKRIEVPPSQMTIAANVNGSSGSNLDENFTSGLLELAKTSDSSKITSSNLTLKIRTSELKKHTQLDNRISTSGSSFKQVLKRTRYKLLKGVTVSKKASGPHNKVSKKRETLKANKKHLQTLLMLRGVPFQSSKDGKALKRINTSLTAKLASTKTPMKTRFQAVGSYITRVASQLVNRSVYKLNKRKKTGKSSTLSSTSVSNLEQEKDCIFFIRFGKCHKGNSCKFQHDPKKVSICTKFLRGTCKAEKCPFSHKVDKDKMPLCSYFQQGQCNATNCPYRHSYFRKDIPHCENFLRGFCEKGQLCSKQHILVCTRTECSQDPKICPLFHKKKTKVSEAQMQEAAKKRKHKTLVVRQKRSLERDEAWPEFVTLSGSDDEVADLQMEMPSRTSENIKRFLERRTRPVWPDHSSGFSADPIDLRNLIKVNSQLRQTIRKARWLRKVRPIKILGEFIPLHFTPEPPVSDQSAVRARVKRRRLRKRASKKSSTCNSMFSGESSDETLSSVRPQKERVFETDDDEDFDPAYRTYGEALRRTKRMRVYLGSAESLSSYTSTTDSAAESVPGKDSGHAGKFVPENHRDAASSAPKRIAMNDDDEWLLDYLCHCDHAVSPLPEPERLDFFGPVYEHWEFRTGDRIRETIGKFRCTIDPETSLVVMTTKPPAAKKIRGGLEMRDFIPLRDHEEGEILTESDNDEITASGDDLAVVDMELASDDDAVMSAEEEKRELSFNEPDERMPPRNVEQCLESVDDISDLEEGEVL